MLTLAQIFYHPMAAVRSLKQQPRWLAAFIIVAAAGMLHLLLLFPDLVRATSTHLPAGATAADRYTAIEELTGAFGVRCAFLPVRLLIGWSCFSLLLYYAGRAFPAPEPARLKHFFALEAHAEAILMLGSFVTLAVSELGTTRLFPGVMPFSLGAFVSSPDANVAAAFNTVDIFNLWYIGVLGTGIAALTGIRSWKAFLIALSGWGCVLLFNIGALELLRGAMGFAL